MGLTEGQFKTRYNNHKASFKNEKTKNSTELSKYIWRLKEEDKEYKLDWAVIGRAQPYSNRTKKCNLCNLEKYFIMYEKNMSSLNSRTEITSGCRHARKVKLANLQGCEERGRKRNNDKERGG